MKFSSGLAVCVWGGGGSTPDWLKKALTFFCFVFFSSFFVSPQLIFQRECSDHGFFKDNYHLTVTFRYSMEKDGPTFPGGPTFPRRRGSNCIFLYKPIEFVIFQGAGVRIPAPPSGSARGIVNWVHPHIVLAKRHSMTLTPLMQVLCGLGKQRQGPTVYWLEIRFGVSKMPWVG